MIVEKYSKSVGGPAYYSIYYRYGQVVVSVSNIRTEDKEEALSKAAKYLQKALEEK